MRHITQWATCKKCPLHKQRSTVCHLRGYVPADILFVGEAPGSVEDLNGEPFTGPAGRILDEIITDVRYEIKEFEPKLTDKLYAPILTYAITNTVGCHPPGNRDPQQEEMATCVPRLYELIDLVTPKVCITIGTIAKEQSENWEQKYTVSIVHPAYISRLDDDQQITHVRQSISTILNAVRRL